MSDETTKLTIAGTPKPVVRANGFVLAIEFSKDFDLHEFMQAVGDHIMKKDGVESVDFEHIGELELIGEDDDQTVSPVLQKKEMN